MRVSPLGTSATVWPIVPAPDDTWWWMWSSWWNENWQGKPKYSEKTCPSAILSATNPAWPDLGSNPGGRGGKPATTRLSHGSAFCPRVSNNGSLVRQTLAYDNWCAHGYVLQYHWDVHATYWRSIYWRNLPPTFKMGAASSSECLVPSHMPKDARLIQQSDTSILIHTGRTHYLQTGRLETCSPTTVHW
jgi:hypothetical protein